MIDVTAEIFPLDFAVVVPFGEGKIVVGSMHHPVMGALVGLMPMNQILEIGVEVPDTSMTSGKGIYLTFAKKASVHVLLKGLQNLLDTWPADEPSSESPTDA